MPLDPLGLQVVSLAGALIDSGWAPPAPENMGKLVLPTTNTASRAELFFPLNTTQGRGQGRLHACGKFCLRSGCNERAC